MARKKKQEVDDRNWAEDFADGGMIDISLGEEILESMRTYIDYTLTQRAIGYIDGLKPVHRAALWCMWKMGLKSSASYTKSQAIAGQIIEKYHPHSSDAAYLAAAGLARADANDERCGACALNLCLIDGHGNFGASFEDEPAAPRYTEMKLSKTGESCVQEITKGAVFMQPSFDAKNVIPELMPTRLPLLLINGSKGLAYGYNVEWLPHNPSEVIKAFIHRIDNPKCSVSDIRKIMPGPDFPSGGIVIDWEEDGITKAYETGFGSMTLASRYKIEEGERGKHIISIYETPYREGRSGGKNTDKKPKSILAAITRFAQSHPECGILDAKNLSDLENQCLIEITVKATVDAEAVARALIHPSSQTKLAQTFGYRQSAVIGKFEPSETDDANGNKGVLRLVDPKPHDLGVLDYMDAFIDFRRACITNYANHEIEKALHEKHLIDGMLKALIDIDKVIAIVRKSKDAASARVNLMKTFKLDEIQADYVLSIPLSRLTRSDKIKLEGNSKALAAKAKELKKIIATRKSLMAEIRRQFEEELTVQKLPRRTTIVSAKGKIMAKPRGENVEETQAIVNAVLGKGDASLQASGKAAVQAVIADVAASSTKNAEAAYLTPDGEIGEKPDAYVQKLDGIGDELLVIYADGSSTRIKPYEITSKPSLVGKRAVGIAPYTEKDPINIAMVSSDGKVKVLDAKTLTKNPDCDVMKLSAGCEILVARPVAETKEGEQNFVLVTSNANILRFAVSSVPVQGRTSAGVAGIKLAQDAKLIDAFVANDKDILVTKTDSTIKNTPLSEYPTKGRGTQGVRCHKFLSGETALTAAYVGSSPKRSDKKSLPKIAARDASGTKQAGLSKVTFSE